MTHPVLVRLSVLAVLAVLAVLPIRAVPGADDMSPEAIKKELKEALQAKTQGRINMLVKRLLKADDPNLVGFLVEAAVGLPSDANYQAAKKAIADFKNEAALDALGKKAKPENKDFRQRVLIIEAFGLRKDEKTRKTIYDCLDDPNVQAQVAAIQATVTRKEKEAIPELIKVVETHTSVRDRGLLEARQALTDLTDEDFEAIEDWKKWWESHKDSFDPKKLGESKGPTQRKRVNLKKTKDSVEFFGKEIVSKNVIFVIDCSGSMVLYDDIEGFQGKNIEFDGQRLTRAKGAMLNAIRKLRGKSKFNIIAYNSKVFPWKGGLVPATSGNIGVAENFIRKFKADQLTYTDEAMEKAFDDPNVDTIVLLSDGAPFKGPGRDPFELQEKIIKRVKDLNSSRKVRIDTFGFEGEGKIPKAYGGGSGGATTADSSMVKFLKELAEKNGGEYHPVK